MTNLLAAPARRAELREELTWLRSWTLTQTQCWDIELLLNGSFFPLDGFMVRQAYEAVCRRMRLADGSLWPIPVVLDVSEEFASSLTTGDRLALRHPEGIVLAVMTVRDIWKPDREAEADWVYGTTNERHPGVFRLLHQTNPAYIGGPVEGIAYPPHYTYKHLRHTPAEISALFRALGWTRVIAFQTRNPMHRAHVELTKRAMEAVGANLLLHPSVGRTGPGDIDYFTRVRCYEAVLKHYPARTVLLSLLPLAMRMAGPREAIWHALIRRNHGCTHFIVGRDHAGPKDRENGQSFYEPTAAFELAKSHEAEMGIEILGFDEMVYNAHRKAFMLVSEMMPGEQGLSLSGTELRRRLRSGEEIPDWFSYPEVLDELRKAYRPPAQQGFTVFFTGLPASGKSTIAGALMAKLMEIGTRPVTLLDGDVVRQHLSSELGFSRRDRDINIRRIGFVAAEITKNGGVAICAPIAPYEAARREVREMVSQYGGFVEVYVATPLAVCERRDPKGLYAKARAGLIKQFTGISDPYEPPSRPDLTVDTSSMSAEEIVEAILTWLHNKGFVG